MKRHILLTLFLLIGCTDSYRVMPLNDQGYGPDGRSTVGNGGGDDPLRGNAWFLGERPIRVCWVNGTSATKERLESYGNQAFKMWRDYLAKKKVNSGEFHPERAALKSEHQLYLNHVFVACDENPDLRLFVGSTTDEGINYARTKVFAGKSAFTLRHKYEAATGWSFGDVWVSSPNRLEDSRRTLLAERVWIVGHLMHELGHILGCGHVPSTILADDFVSDLDRTIAEYFDKPEDDDNLRHVGYEVEPDGRNELLICEDCAFSSENSDGLLHSNWPAVWSVLPEATIKQIGILYGMSVQREERGPFEVRFSATEEQDTWKHTFPIQNLTLTQRRLEDVPIFKVSVGTPTPTVVASYQSTLAYEGILPGQSGEHDVPISLVRNGENYQLSLDGFGDPWLYASRMIYPTPP